MSFPNCVPLVELVAAGEVSVFACFSDDDEEEGGEKASGAPQPLSSDALLKLAEGDEDVVEDLELSDDD